MGDKSKVLCKWDKKDYRKKMDKLRTVVADPRWVCRDCGRVAVEKRWLCDPTELHERD